MKNIPKVKAFSSVDNGPIYLKTVVGSLVGRCVDTPFTRSRVRDMCISYWNLDAEAKHEILKYIASKQYAEKQHVREITLKHPAVKGKGVLSQREEAEKEMHALSPNYSEFFNLMLKMDGGIKFIIDLRADLLNMLPILPVEDPSSDYIRSLSIGLKEILLHAFNPEFLNITRITWDSSSEMLQKICMYEAVHPVKSWTDIKRRVGPYRRCFVLMHRSMSCEPLVILHTALTDEISSNINAIIADQQLNCRSISTNYSRSDHLVEDPDTIKAAIFYSISSTQKGLRGIDLGNQLIKQAVRELLKEFPHIQKFSTLSPIPGFRQWLLMQVKRGNPVVFSYIAEEELFLLQKIICNHGYSDDLREAFYNLIHANLWISDLELQRLLRIPLLKMCAHYLYNEKRRSYAFDSVAHFHLRNGAVIWRLNWNADPSPNGLRNSCGIMVNYRYFLEDTENNSKHYTENYSVVASEEFTQLLTFSHQSSL